MLLTKFRGSIIMITIKDNPFTPVEGGIPPFIAGRDAEIAFIKRCIDSLNQGCPFENFPKVLIGPAGMGKSVLLDFASKFAKANFCHVVNAHPDHFNEFDNPTLINLILNKKVKNEIVVSEPNLNHELEKILEKKLSKSAVLLILNHAHKIDTAVISKLGNIIESIAFKGLAFEVLFAGTPKLENKLDNCRSGINYKRKIKYLNILDNESTKSAITKPLERFNVKFKDNTLDYLVKLSGNQPSFIQIIGSLVWSELFAKKTNICCKNIINDIELYFNELRCKYFSILDKKIINASLVNEVTETFRLLKSKEKINNNKINFHLINSFNICEDVAHERCKKLYELEVIWDGDDGLVDVNPVYLEHFLINYEYGSFTI